MAALALIMPSVAAAAYPGDQGDFSVEAYGIN